MTLGLPCDAALFRAIDQRKPTLFFNEVDSVFNPRARERGTKDDLRALLNAGYRRGEVVLRMGGGNHTELQTFQVFGAKALAGLGSLPPSLASRCLRIEFSLEVEQAVSKVRLLGPNPQIRESLEIKAAVFVGEHVARLLLCPNHLVGRPGLHKPGKFLAPASCQARRAFTPESPRASR
jgi:hypothetical protein